MSPNWRHEPDLDRRKLDTSLLTRAADAGGSLGASIVHAMWQDAIQNAAVISTDATGALVQPEKHQDGQRQACKKGHFFTAAVDCEHVLFAYAERHTQEAVRQLFGGFKGFLQSDASSVYDILDRGPPKDEYLDEVMRALPDWPKERYLELSPKYWTVTRGNLLSADLESPLCSFTVPPAALNFAR